MQKINEYHRSRPESQKNQLASSLKQIEMPQEPIGVFMGTKIPHSIISLPLKQ